MTKHIHSEERCKELLRENIREELKAGYPYHQAVAIAFDKAEKRGCTPWLPKKKGGK